MMDPSFFSRQAPVQNYIWKSGLSSLLLPSSVFFPASTPEPIVSEWVGEAITTRHVPLLNRQPQPTLRFNVDTLLAPFENNFSFSSLFLEMLALAVFYFLPNFENKMPCNSQHGCCCSYFFIVNRIDSRFLLCLFSLGVPIFISLLKALIHEKFCFYLYDTLSEFKFSIYSAWHPSKSPFTEYLFFSPSFILVVRLLPILSLAFISNPKCIYIYKHSGSSQFQEHFILMSLSCLLRSPKRHAL